MTAERLGKLLAEIRPVRIGVLGDFCLDAYWTLDASRSETSLETGLATRSVIRQRYSLGGAGNVVSNLVAMGVRRVSAFGVLGCDPFGREMLRLLREQSVDMRGVLTQETGWNTPTYVKPLEGGTEQARIDLGGSNRLDPEKGRALLRAVQEALPELDILVVNQQLPHGIHTEELRGGLVALMAEARLPFICDSRSFSDSYAGAIRKLNEREALRLCAAVPGGFGAAGPAHGPSLPLCRHDAERAADALFKRWAKPVFLTRGARGMLVRDERGLWEVPGLQVLGRVDTVGAGDSALAGIAAAMAARADPREAATLGNFAAGVTVRKLFVTGTASPREILAIGADPDYVHCPELADDPRAARYLADSEIEIVASPPYGVFAERVLPYAAGFAGSEAPGGSRITDAIFDHDGTISTLREGWERIMEPVMIRAILGDRWKSAQEELYRSVQERVREYIEATTGVQTLVQMQGLVDLAGELGLVPPAEVKDAAFYMALYDKELLALVRRRTAKLERGELGAENYLLCGARPMLEALRAGGMKLHLVSGTADADLKAEAEALGVASFFEGRIHGAVGDLNKEAKRIVVENVLMEAKAGSAGAFVAFCDGPVEVREAKRRGGCAVGVASDELRRFGWNMRKRSRVIKAGADLVVPDFTQWKKLLEALGIRR